MTDTTLGRTVASRVRHARSIALGDRSAPKAKTPALLVTPEELETLSPEVALAPFTLEYDSSSLPPTMRLTGRANISVPFDDDEPRWEAQMQHVLPPTLEEADTGIRGSEPSGLMPVSWQSLRHDATLMEEGFHPEFIVLVDALQIAGHPGRLVRALALLRTRFPQSLIWCPGISGPDNLALLTWFGVDLHDLSRSQQAAVREVLLTASGPREPLEEVGESAAMADQLAAWEREIAAVKVALANGSLRELVEKRALNAPRLVEHLRHHDQLMLAALSPDAAQKSGFDEEVVAVAKTLAGAPLTRYTSRFRKWRCHSTVSRQDPLIADWVDRIESEYQPPAEQSKILVLLPCSARKPYSYSQSHRRFRRNIRHRGIHEMMVTAPLGLVPRELEELWPAAHYDIPVTGEWDSEELATIHRLVKAVVARTGYELVIDHSGLGFTGEELGVEVVETRQGEGAGSFDALNRLEAATKEAAATHLQGVHIGEKQHLHFRFKSISRWLHGDDSWLAGARVVGRPPRWKLEVAGQQYAIWNPQLGRFSFAKASIPHLAKCGTLSEVHLTDGPEWKGDIFSPMVERTEGQIRAGDELFVYRDGKLLGSARSVAPGWEYRGSPGRVAKAQQRL